MPKELAWQRKIIKSVQRQGGYGKKWSSTYAVGVPDLILVLPEFGPFFMEVKLEHSIKDGFNRKLGVTERQQLELARLGAAGARALLGAVVYRTPRDVCLYALPPGAQRVRDGMGAPVVQWGGKDGFDMINLIGRYIKTENML